MKEAFNERFKSHKTNKQIYKLQQSDRETGAQYLTRVQELAMGADNLSETAIVDLAINGLQSNLRTFVVGRDPKSFEDLRKAIDIGSNVIDSCSANTAPAKCNNDLGNATVTNNDVNSMFAFF